MVAEWYFGFKDIILHCCFKRAGPSWDCMVERMVWPPGGTMNYVRMNVFSFIAFALDVFFFGWVSWFQMAWPEASHLGLL